MLPVEVSRKYRWIRSIISATLLVFFVILSLRLSGQDLPGRLVEKPGSVYGEYMEWEKVKGIFAKNKKALVIDMDTGMSFYVKRRGGTLHADVEPLTAEDTVEMQKVFGGNWSWKRRAVLVNIEGTLIAGSMNGMPHGGGNISDNNFPGHSCIHFRGSKLHINGREDLAHRMMVYKAAGRIEELVTESSPEEVLKIFFTALEQGELNILTRVTHFTNPDQVSQLLKKAETVERVRVLNTSPGKGETVSVKLAIEFKKDKTSYEKTKDVQMINSSVLGWRVECSSVEPLMMVNREADWVLSEIEVLDDIEEN
ncbi:MAG: hypothetical protein ACOY46_05525 [Bacillota bacterium]